MRSLNYFLLIFSFCLFFFEKNSEINFFNSNNILENGLAGVLSKAISNAFRKNSDELIDFSGPFTNKFRIQTDDLIEIETILNKNFQLDSEVNYLIDLDSNFEKVITDKIFREFYDESSKQWKNAYENSLISENFLINYIGDKDSISEKLSFLAKKEVIIFYGIISYSEEAESATKNKSKTSSKKKTSRDLKCLKLFNLISTKFGYEIDYEDRFQPLIENGKCPRLKPESSEIRDNLLKIISSKVN